MNLLMIAPLCDSRGKVRYHIGAQVDVSGLVKECSDLESLHRLVAASEAKNGDPNYMDSNEASKKDEFQELSEMLNLGELDTVRRWGGRMHREQQEEDPTSNGNGANWNKPRLLIHEQSPDRRKPLPRLEQPSGKLSGVYENYLLVRPYPSLRILFASPSLRVPGILQSAFMSKIGGSNRVRDELTQALADGRGVTAKVKWVTKLDSEGRNRWIHCTPLLGSNGAIGVWMIIVVDDDREVPIRKFRQAPPVDPRIGRLINTREEDGGSLRDFARANGARDSATIERPPTSQTVRTDTRSDSPYTLRLD
jgi:hypothetical protein